MPFSHLVKRAEILQNVTKFYEITPQLSKFNKLQTLSTKYLASTEIKNPFNLYIYIQQHVCQCNHCVRIICF